MKHTYTKQFDVLATISHKDRVPLDIRERPFVVGQNVMGPCSENEIIEAKVLSIEKHNGTWKLHLHPYSIGGIFFDGYPRWIERYWRFIILT